MYGPAHLIPRKVMQGRITTYLGTVGRHPKIVQRDDMWIQSRGPNHIHPANPPAALLKRHVLSLNCAYDAIVIVGIETSGPFHSDLAIGARGDIRKSAKFVESQIAFKVQI